ncbi:DUF6390 family protein [Nocardia xishanensis]|uniref:DUF6390 family protein n=1 Tax=Nocardia xishanensis TaxID=238964 RepID=UPI00082C6D1C
MGHDSASVTETTEGGAGGIDGTEMFARYAHAPNALGYCGPAESAPMATLPPAAVRAMARQFSGAWPYLRVMSRLTGIDDPLDHRLVESYWLGGGIGARLDPAEFLAELLAVIGPVAGHYWAHLTPDLASEAAANHCFHVFGVYPWTRLLGRGNDEHPVRVLDNCRITWGAVVSRTENELTVLARRLEWDGHRLELTAPAPRQIPVWVDGYSPAPEVDARDLVALHWDRLCGPLAPEQVHDLADSTARQLSVTNDRLSRK